MTTEEKLKKILKKHGFETAADLIELKGITNKILRKTILSWADYPECMDIYPSTLSPKIYNELTTEYFVIHPRLLLQKYS